MPERKTSLSLSRRDFLRYAGTEVATSLLPWPIIQFFFESEQPGSIKKRGTENLDFREKRQLSRKALIVGGGVTDANNYLGFYLDTLLWYYLCRDILLVPSSDITVLYFDGRPPQKDQILNMTADRQTKVYLKRLLTIYPTAGLPIAAEATKNQFQKHLSDLVSTPEVAQLLVFRSGHGTLHWEETSQGQRTAYSAMRFLGDKLLTSEEYRQALQGNQNGAVVSFLNQCEALLFLQLTETIPNLAILTSNGSSGMVERALQDKRINISWPWSMAAREALLYPHLADPDRNGQINLHEMQRYILAHDYMATTGFNAEWSLEPVRTHPGFSWGAAINPQELILLQYQ